MKRREFFRTLGLSALVAPLLGKLKPKDDGMPGDRHMEWKYPPWDGYAHVPDRYPWYNIVSICPECGCKLNIPSTSPIAKPEEDGWLYEAKIPCGRGWPRENVRGREERCKGIHNISVRVKNIGFKAYWRND